MKTERTIRLRFGREVIYVREPEPFVYYATFVANEYGQLSLGQGDVVLDAGANIGDFTIKASKKVGNTGLVVAVEPNPENVKILKKNVEVNFLNNVVIIPFALSNKESWKYLSKNEVGGSITDQISEIKVKTVTIMSILKQLNLDHFDVIKMDIEGAEEFVFEELGFLTGVREIAIELHGKCNIESIPIRLGENGFALSHFTVRSVILNTLRAIVSHPFQVASAEVFTKFLMCRSILQFLIGKNPVPSLGETDLTILYARRNAV